MDVFIGHAFTVWEMACNFLQCWPSAIQPLHLMSLLHDQESSSPSVQARTCMIITHAWRMLQALGLTGVPSTVWLLS